MNFSMSAIIASFVFGLAGVFVLYRGKAEGKFWNCVIGIVLMSYPIVVADDLMIWGIGVALLVAAWLTW